MTVTSDRLMWIAAAGFLLATFGATGVKALQEFSRHALDVYCRRRNRRELFKEIVGLHDDVSLGAECLQILGTVVGIGAGALLASRQTPEMTVLALAGWMGCGMLLLLACLAWIPWAVTRVISAPFLFHTWPLWKALDVVAMPVAFGATLLSSVVARLAGRPDPEDEDEEETFEDEIRTIVSQGIGEGVIEEGARDMIEGVFDLDETDVGDVMTPRSKVDAIEVDTPWTETVEFVTRVRRTRIPVFEQDFDHVIGVLYVKDLLAVLADPPENTDGLLRKLLREPRKVLRSMPLDDMLQEFRHHRSHLAIVQDEYGGIEGVVTIEDVLEEIVGEIHDEKDVHHPEIQTVDENTTEAVGSTHVMDINEALGVSLPEGDDYDTIGGYLIRQLGRIPRPKDFVVCDGMRITVLDATNRQVQRVRLQREGPTLG